MGFVGNGLAWSAAISLWVASGWGHWTQARPRQAASESNSAASAASTTPVPDLSGFWEIKDMTNRGLRGGAVIGDPAPPVLTPKAQAAAQAARKQQAAGQVVSETSRYCKTLAYPFFMTSSPPFDIVQGPNEILVLAEREMGSRHIYLNQDHLDAAHLQLTANGDSVAHWEGDTLVVDTIGFKPGDGGGGNRSAQAHLVEKYRLFDGGKRLSVTFSWTDPEVYEKPYTYELGYYRSSADAYAMEDWCDASDQSQWRSDATPLAPSAKPTK
jgi:hypothetical protein